MRLLVPLFVFASTSGFALLAQTPSIDGQWKIHSTFAGNESDTVCTFTQEDNRLTGMCKSEHGEGKATGKVDGTKIAWTYETQYNGSLLTLSYAGALDSAAHKIAGSVSVVQMGLDGVFTATQPR